MIFEEAQRRRLTENLNEIHYCENFSVTIRNGLPLFILTQLPHMLRQKITDYDKHELDHKLEILLISN